MVKYLAESQLRELAVAADEIRYELSVTRSPNYNYCEGVADVLRLIAGDISARDNAVLQRIYTRYLDNGE